MKRAWVVAVGLTCWMAGARAQVTTIPLAVDCAAKDGESVCVVPEALLDKILETNNRNVMLLAGAMARIKELEAEGPKPKCAELEVVPKPKIPKEKTL